MGENICKFKTAWPYRICLFTRARPVLDFKEKKKKIMLINGSVKFVCNNESSKLVDSAQLSCYSARAAYSLEYCIVNYGNLVCDLCDGIMCLSFSALFLFCTEMPTLSHQLFLLLLLFVSGIR